MNGEAQSIMEVAVYDLADEAARIHFFRTAEILHGPAAQTGVDFRELSRRPEHRFAVLSALRGKSPAITFCAREADVQRCLRELRASADAAGGGRASVLMQCGEVVRAIARAEL